MVTPVWLLRCAFRGHTFALDDVRTHFFHGHGLQILLHAFHSVVRAMMATMTMARGHYELYISSDYDI